MRLDIGRRTKFFSLCHHPLCFVMYKTGFHQYRPEHMKQLLQSGQLYCDGKNDDDDDDGIPSYVISGSFLNNVGFILGRLLWRIKNGENLITHT